MAVAVIMDFEGATLDQYDEVMQKMGLVKGAPGPAGALFHWVTGTDGGIKVTDVWEDKATFEAFAADHIGPAAAAAGVPGAPTITYEDVHNYQTPAGD